MTSFTMAYTYEEYVEAIDRGNDVNETDYDGKTPLFHVSSFNLNDYIMNYRKIINLFLENGANINHQDENGFTAVMNSDSDNFSLCLLELGCDIEVKDTDGENIHILTESTIRGHTNSIEYMVKHMGVRVNDKINGETPLNIVLKYMNKYNAPWSTWTARGVKKLIELGANVHAIDKNRFPPIYHARESYECMLYLIRAGADVNTELPVDETLLHLSCYYDYRISKLLLRNGADENKLTSDGSSPLIRLMNKDEEWESNDENILCNFIFRSEPTCSLVNKNGISIFNSKKELPDWIKTVVDIRVKNENWKRRSWIIMYKMVSGNMNRKKEYNVIENVIKTPCDVFRKIIEYV